MFVLIVPLLLFELIICHLLIEFQKWQHSGAWPGMPALTGTTTAEPTGVTHGFNE